MLQLFKKLTTIYNIILWMIIAVGGVLGAWFILEFEFPGIMILGLLLSVLIITFSVSFALNILASKKHNDVIMILQQECDPIKYLNEYYSLTQRPVSNEIKPMIVLNLVAGYIACGDYAQAKSSLLSIDITKVKPEEKRLYYCHWAKLSICEENFEEAEKNLNIAIQFAETEKINPKHLIAFETSKSICKATINIEKGNFDGVEKTLEDIFNKSVLMYHKVSVKYALGKLYIKQNIKDKSVEAMKYVAENGNTLDVAQSARRYLKSIT